MRPVTRTLLALTAAPALALPALVAGPAAAAETGDPFAAAQYGLDQVRAPAAWAATRGAGVTIGVVDAGVDLDHPDLAGRTSRGATFLGCGASSCGDGDWQSGPRDRAEFDSVHGTHVAGIAAAVTGNGTGIAGVAPDAAVLPVKVLDDDGGSFEDIAAGVRYAADNGAQVINLSLGALPGVQALTYTGLISDTTEAIAYASSKGVLVVAAAGNETFPLCGTPAFDDGALCVTSTDKREAPSFFSNGGIKPDMLSVAAPGGSGLPVCGEDIVSTVPVGTSRSGAACGYGGDYDELAGTSMAAPHVAGVAALLYAQGRDRAGVLAALTSTARQPVLGVRGAWTPGFGFGIVDAAAAAATPGASTAGGGKGDKGEKGGKGGNGGGGGGKSGARSAR